MGTIALIGEHQEMTVYELQKLLEDKNPKMEIKIVCDDTERIYDLVGEDKSIIGGAPIFYFLEAKRLIRASRNE
jgi:hypothetical protein